MPTPKLVMVYLVEGQVNAETIANGNFNRIDSMIHMNVLDRDLTAPPGSPVTGATYIVKATGTGAWAGHDAALALYYNGWIFITPTEGMTAWIADENKFFVYDGSAWVVQPREATAIADLTTTPSATYIQSEHTAIYNKINALLAAMRVADSLT